VARIGIDLGTWNSADAFSAEKGQLTPISSRDGETLYGKTFPSFVFFDANGEVCSIGEHAKNEWALNPGLVVWGVKRFVGMPYDEAFKAEDGFSLFGYRDRIERTDSGRIAIRFGSKVYTPTDVLAITLRRIKEDSENVQLNPMLNGKVDGAVITVPAYFDPTRVGPVLHAAELAGFGKAEVNVTQIAEPTAAMLSYVSANRNQLPRGGKGLHILTFDIGAGTTDVTLNRCDSIDGGIIVTEVSVEGDNHVGGINMDSALLGFLKSKYASTGLAGDATAQAKLRDSIERTKIELTEYRDMEKASLSTAVSGKPTRFELSRDEMVAALSPVWDRAVLPLHELFRTAKRRANIGPDRVDIVLFVGGPSKMPWLRQRVSRELAEIGLRADVLAQIDRIDTDGFPLGCDPMKAVAHGAALTAEGHMGYVNKLNKCGYGVTLGKDYYECILKETQPYPTREEKLGLSCRTTHNLVSVPLVRKTTATNPESPRESKVEYVSLQELDFFLPGEAGVPQVEVSLQITDNKRLMVQIVNPSSGHKTKYENADLFKLSGESVELQDTEPPSAETPPPEPPRPTWTALQLRKARNAAMAAIDLGKTSSCLKEIASLKDATALASRPDVDPNAVCPEILNRTSVLLYALRAADAMSEEEFLTSRALLRSIEKGV